MGEFLAAWADALDALQVVPDDLEGGPNLSCAAAPSTSADRVRKAGAQGQGSGLERSFPDIPEPMGVQRSDGKPQFAVQPHLKLGTTGDAEIEGLGPLRLRVELIRQKGSRQKVQQDAVIQLEPPVCQDGGLEIVEINPA